MKSLIISGFLMAALVVGCSSKENTADTAAPAAPVAEATAPAPVVPDHAQHAGHDHVHGDKCGHKAVQHGDHKDYVHDGHYHAMHETHVDDHGMVKVTAADICPKHEGHDHKHGKNCGHKSIKHDKHVDYDHDGHLHVAHGDHADEHGKN